MPLQPQRSKLDARLAAAEAYVRRGGVCADIGCDHGLLCVHLLLHGVCTKVIACDLRPQPLAVAARNLARHGCEQRAECRLGDGLSVLLPDEAQDIVIAGVSGETVCDILAAAPQHWRPETRFILVPASKPERLRRWLCTHGFALLDETPVEAARRFYTVMHVAYTGEETQPDALFCAVGLCAKQGEAAQGYLKKAAGALRGEGRDALAQQVEEVRERCKT